MSDKDIITAAYQDTIKQVYTAFFSSYVGDPDSAARQQAEQLFATGITTARAVLARALAVLPP